MTRRDRARKRRLATLHTRTQRRDKEFALVESRHAAEFMGKNGRLKRPRTGEAFVKALVEEMASRDYVPNGKGGWRKLHTRKTAKQDDMSRTAMAND